MQPAVVLHTDQWSWPSLREGSRPTLRLAPEPAPWFVCHLAVLASLAVPMLAAAGPTGEDAGLLSLRGHSGIPLRLAPPRLDTTWAEALDGETPLELDPEGPLCLCLSTQPLRKPLSLPVLTAAGDPCPFPLG